MGWVKKNWENQKCSQIKWYSLNSWIRICLWIVFICDRFNATDLFWCEKSVNYRPWQFNNNLLALIRWLENYKKTGHTESMFRYIVKLVLVEIGWTVRSLQRETCRKKGIFSVTFLTKFSFEWRRYRPCWTGEVTGTR